MNKIKYNPLNEIYLTEFNIEQVTPLDSKVKSYNTNTNSDVINNVSMDLVSKYYEKHNLPKMEHPDELQNPNINKDNFSSDSWRRIFDADVVDAPDIYYLDINSKAANILMNEFNTKNLDKVLDYSKIYDNRLYFTTDVYNQITNILSRKEA